MEEPSLQVDCVNQDGAMKERCGVARGLWTMVQGSRSCDVLVWRWSLERQKFYFVGWKPPGGVNGKRVVNTTGRNNIKTVPLTPLWKDGVEVGS